MEFLLKLSLFIYLLGFAGKVEGHTISLWEKSNESSILSEKIRLDESIHFVETSWVKAQELSRKTGKPIFVNFHAVWCAPCKVMKYKTFGNNELAEYFNENYINLRLDGEVGEGKALMEAFGLRAYPSSLFFSSKGDLLWGQSGYLSADLLLKVAKSLP